MPLSQKTLEFLMENRIRNNRDWFHSQKERYQEVLVRPMAELCMALAPTIEKIDPLLVTEPKVGKAISRVWRDTRYSKDKSLFREVMWLAFCRRSVEGEDAPGLVFEFSPDGFRYGCGYYWMPPKVMAAARQLILNGDPVFQRAREAVEGQRIFTLQGEYYKRPKFPAAPEKLKIWLERKNLDLMHDSHDFELLFSDRLAHRLKKGFKTAAPFYEFLMKARDEAHREELG